MVDFMVDNDIKVWNLAEFMTNQNKKGLVDKISAVHNYLYSIAKVPECNLSSALFLAT